MPATKRLETASKRLDVKKMESVQCAPSSGWKKKKRVGLLLPGREADTTHWLEEEADDDVGIDG
jgi:hypothetical protein